MTMPYRNTDMETSGLKKKVKIEIMKKMKCVFVIVIDKDKKAK